MPQHKYINACFADFLGVQDNLNGSLHPKQFVMLFEYLPMLRYYPHTRRNIEGIWELERRTLILQNCAVCQHLCTRTALPFYPWDTAFRNATVFLNQ
jgi:hypothetical protein